MSGAMNGSTRAAPRRRRSWVGLLIPALIAFVVLIGLGTWQIQRKAWKEGLIATLNTQLAAPPIALPAPATWAALDRSENEYRRVTFQRHVRQQQGSAGICRAVDVPSRRRGSGILGIDAGTPGGRRAS